MASSVSEKRRGVISESIEPRGSSYLHIRFRKDQLVEQDNNDQGYGHSEVPEGSTKLKETSVSRSWTLKNQAYLPAKKDARPQLTQGEGQSERGQEKDGGQESGVGLVPLLLTRTGTGDDGTPGRIVPDRDIIRGAIRLGAIHGSISNGMRLEVLKRGGVSKGRSQQ